MLFGGGFVPGGILARYPYLLPRFVFGVGTMLIPRMMRGHTLTPFTTDFARQSIARVGLQGSALGDMATKMRQRVRDDPDGVLKDLSDVILGEGGPVLEHLRVLSDTFAPDDFAGRSTVVSTGAVGSDSGHLDISVQVMPRSPNGKTEDERGYDPLAMMVDSIPGGGAAIPAEVQEEYEKALEKSPEAAADVLRSSRDLGNFVPVPLGQPVEGLYWLGAGNAVGMAGHRFLRMADGTFVSAAHAFTTPQHALDGWRTWMYIELPSGERVLVTLGAGKHPVSGGDRFNTAATPWMFATAFDKYCLAADLRPMLIDKFGIEEVNKGNLGACYYELFKAAAARGAFHIITNEALLVSGNFAFGETMVNARRPVPNMASSVKPAEIPRMLKATPEQTLTAVAYAAEKAGVAPLTEKDLPPLRAAGDPPIPMPSKTVDIGTHLPPAGTDPGHWVPTKPDEPWTAPVDPSDPYDPGPGIPGEAPPPITDRQFDPHDPYDPEDEHDKEDRNNPKDWPPGDESPHHGPEGPRRA